MRILVTAGPAVAWGRRWKFLIMDMRIQFLYQKVSLNLGKVTIPLTHPLYQGLPDMIHSPIVHWLAITLQYPAHVQYWYQLRSLSTWLNSHFLLNSQAARRAAVKWIMACVAWGSSADKMALDHPLSCSLMTPLSRLFAMNSISMSRISEWLETEGVNLRWNHASQRVISNLHGREIREKFR